MELKGFYNENILGEMLAKGEITRLEYVYHHSEEMRDDYIGFCKEKGLEQNEQSAEDFMEYQKNQEEAAHTECLD